jgi:hypothetical protein
MVKAVEIKITRLKEQDFIVTRNNGNLDKVLLD